MTGWCGRVDHAPISEPPLAASDSATTISMKAVIYQAASPASGCFELEARMGCFCSERLTQ